MNYAFKLALGTGLLVFGASVANAAAVGGGTTVVQPTIDLGAAGLRAAPFGSTTVGTDGQGDTIFQFGISGGDLDGLAGTIEHSGVGVDLSSQSSTLSLRNFQIDTTTQSISGDVYVNDAFAANAGIFDFNVASLGSTDELFDLSDPMLSIRISDAAGGVINDVFGVSGLAGAEFGLAATQPQVVPLPGALFLFGSALAGLVVRKKLSAT